MRPPMASDHVAEPRLRVIMLQKQAPYNSGEERGLSASMARRYCVLGMAMPAPKREEGVRVMNRETGEFETVEDELGGWSLSKDEAAAASQFAKAREDVAGDYRKEPKDPEGVVVERRDEQVADKPSEKPKKPGGFLRGNKPEKSEAKTEKPKNAAKNKPEKKT